MVARAQSAPVQLTYDFRDGSLGWQAGYADYTTDIEESYEMRAEVRPLPAGVGAGGTGFYVQGHNRSDDLFMFLKRRLGPADGVTAGQRYRVSYVITLASSAPSGCVGSGGAPGESVILKAGASPNEPLSIPVEELTYRRMNVGIGDHQRGGSAASVAGNIANGQPCAPGTAPFVSIQRSHQHTTEVTATSAGGLWLLVGTDSGFEGLTTLYYQRIEVRLAPVGAPSPEVPELLLEEATGRAVAFDSVTMMRDPLPPDTAHNFSQDRRARVTLFAANVGWPPGGDAPGVTAQVEDVFGRLYPAAVEHVARVPGFDQFTQITVRLPEGASSRRVWVSVSVGGAASNSALVLLRPAAANSP